MNNRVKMNHTIAQFLNKHATWKTIFFLFVIVMFFNFFLFPVFHSTNADNTLLDTQFSYAVNDAYLILDNYSAEEREEYFWGTLTLDQFPYLTVLKSRKGTTLYSRSNRSTTIINDDYEVVMLNETHRVKVVVQSFEKKEKAMKFAEQFVLAYIKQLVKYNPVVSDATLRRRRRSEERRVGKSE